MARRYRFGGFRLDPATRELWQDDRPVVLPPRLFECLLWLIEHRDRAVGRDELIATVWGRSAVTDNVLAQVVARLRRVVDADARDSAIRTVPRFGYRWVAATTVESAAAPGAAGPPAGTGRQRRGRRWRAVALGGLAVLLLAVSIAWLRVPVAQRADAAARPAAVLPVERVAGAGEEWMRLGLMALVGDRLRDAGQPVVPDESVVAIVGDAAPDPAAVAAALAGAVPPLLIAARVEATDGGWRVRLQAVGEPDLMSVGDGADLLAAARAASDGLAVRLGHAPAGAAPGPAAFERLLLEVEAATLAGETEAALRLLDTADARQRETPEWRYRAAWTAFVAGRLDPAEAGFAALLEDLPADAPVMRARALNGLANVQYEREDLTGLARSAEQAVALLRGHDAPGELGRALMGQAVAAHRQGRTEAARQGFFQARLALERAGDPLGVARANLSLGIVDARQGRLPDALVLLQDAAQRLAALRSAHDELLAHVHVAHVHLLLLDPAAALAQAEPIARLGGRVRSPRAQVLADLTRAEVLLANGRLDAAGELLRRWCATGCDGPERLPLALARRALGGDIDATLPDLRTALAGLPAGEGGRDAGRAWLAVLAARRTDGAGGAAIAGLRAWAGDAPAATAEVRLYAALAEAEYAAGQGRPAGDAYAAAWREALAGAVPSDLLEVADAYVGWLIRQGDLAGASHVAGHLAGWAGRDFGSALLQLRLRHALGHPAAWRAALAQARALAGERPIPAALQVEPTAPAIGTTPDPAQEGPGLLGDG